MRITNQIEPAIDRGRGGPRTTVGMYALAPDAGAPAGIGASGAAFTRGLRDLLREYGPALALRERWLRPPDPPPPDAGALREAAGALGWTARELGRMLVDGSRHLLFVYPQLPVLAHAEWPDMLRMTERAFRLLGLRARVGRPRVIVAVEALPIERADGLAAAGGPAARLPRAEIRAIERTLFRIAHRVVAPVGLAELLCAEHAVERERIRMFRRHLYRTGGDVGEGGREEGGRHEDGGATEERREARLRELGFESGAVDFFYSGAIGRSVAPNFREVLRAVRQAAATRLHVCGPDAEAVREWLGELEVPNARHYGRLNPAMHDALARRCSVGLILDPSDNPYNHRMPTMQYSAYLANGLAVLSTDLGAVADNLRVDGTGRAMPIRQLTVELLRWATRPKLFGEYRTRAAELGAAVRSGDEHRGWIEEMV